MAARRTLLALRDAMTLAERAAASGAICDAANALVAARLSAGQVLALYAAKGSEVDTTQIDRFARARGLVVAYPRVDGQARLLAFHAVTPEELSPTRFGLREPNADAPAVNVSEIAAFIVPGLAFDRAGWRIGWGRGHYDATLAVASSTALRIGLGFACQVVDGVAHEAHDVALNIIITEVTTHMVV
jgi:5-formyltetrahydrofolate cyclo-ligase